MAKLRSGKSGKGKGSASERHEAPLRSMPATLAGHWLRATALRQHETRRRLVAELKKTGFVGAPEFLLAAFQLAVTRRFTFDQDVRDITEFVKQLRYCFGADNVPLMETEAMIRDALGEAVSLDGIAYKKSVELMGLVFVGVADDLDLPDDEIDGLLIKAELVVDSQGHQLVPMDESLLIPPA